MTTPKAAPAELPLPTAGGAYIRNADGSLSPEPAPAPATPEDAPTAPGHANPEE